MKGNMNMISIMALEGIYLLVEITMKEKLKIVKNMERVDSYIKMEKQNKEDFKMAFIQEEFE